MVGGHFNEGMELRTLLQRADLWASRPHPFIERAFLSRYTPGPRLSKWQDEAAKYIIGLLLPGERKSMQPIASRVPDARYEVLQQFITDAPWDSEAVLDGFNAQLLPVMSGPDGVILLDDSAQPKKGDRSPGVAKQYCGVLGKVENCQVAVSGLYATPAGPANADAVSIPLGMRLYLPEEWAGDPARRKRAGIPEDVEFLTKWQMGLGVVDRARRHRIPHRATLADAGFGDVGDFRAKLREWEEPYVVGVDTSQLRVVPADTVVHPPGTRPPGGNRRHHPWMAGRVRPLSPREVARRLPESEWRTARWAEGTKGALKGTFARTRVRGCQKGGPTDEVGWLLLERRGRELRAYLCWGLDHLSLEELAALAHTRWTVERGYREMKSELGWDHFEGRTWNGFHHHAVLTQIALAFLSLLRWESRERPGESLPTLPEIRRKVVDYVVEELLKEAREAFGGELPPGLQLVANLVKKAG